MQEANEKYMVLCVAGQSNAVGYDESYVEPGYVQKFRGERIRQLGLYGEDNLKIIPLGVCAQSYQDLRPYSNPHNSEPSLGTKGIHLPLCNLLLDDIPEDYKILVISCAYGGTGFTAGEPGEYLERELRPEPGILRWGKDCAYYKAMKARIAYALGLNEANRFLGVVWVQGEQDGGDATGHAAAFSRMTDDFLSYFEEKFPGRVFEGQWNRDVWFNMETTAYWYTQGECPLIWAFYRKWNPSTYVEIPRDTDTNETNGTGLTASIRACHFGNDAYVKAAAPRVAERMRAVWQR